MSSDNHPTLYRMVFDLWSQQAAKKALDTTGPAIAELQAAGHLPANAALDEIDSLTAQVDKLSKALAEIRGYAVKYPYDSGLYEHVLAVTAKAGAL